MGILIASLADFTKHTKCFLFLVLVFFFFGVDWRAFLLYGKY